ncbi:SPRY domain containing protein [Acanthamoeba castellanii str. Neff]|uniref:SPRY domain containing protein n=1 Tax=Acanthamoeba castellanii (strain ATCC 30010 / Neff) TaxID=1257118 RepID=L8GQV9_ACACF|nr:SPRY domain containing protein [Acanthamoeba castellanii str. Neff]ELR15380.1 SPRY domain containing protein [Acanthamoeba castellanii str. Neff]
MAVVCTLGDPHIVAIHGGFVRPRLGVVTDHTPLGSLHELLHNRDLVANDIPPASACTSSTLAHGDLRSANLLLDPAGNVKVGRFGFAGPHHHRGLVGCVPYLAPEVLTAGDGDDGDEVVLEALADVYEFGVTPAAIALRATRDNLRPDSAAAEAGADQAFGAAYRKLLDYCWHRDPLVRLTFGEVSASLAVMPHATTDTGSSGSGSPEDDADEEPGGDTDSTNDLQDEDNNLAFPHVGPTEVVSSESTALLQYTRTRTSVY